MVARDSDSCSPVVAVLPPVEEVRNFKSTLPISKARPIPRTRAETLFKVGEDRHFQDDKFGKAYVRLLQTAILRMARENLLTSNAIAEVRAENSKLRAAAGGDAVQAANNNSNFCGSNTTNYEGIDEGTWCGSKIANQTNKCVQTCQEKHVVNNNYSSGTKAHMYMHGGLSSATADQPPSYAA